MKLILHIILIFFTLSVHAQGEQLNFTDAKGKKQGKWIVYEKEKPDSIRQKETHNPYNGYFERYNKIVDSMGHIDSVLYEKGSYINDRKEGQWIKYFDDGKTIKLIAEYKNNRPAGKYWKYWENGTLKEVGTFTKNLQQDSLIRYYYNGSKDFELWNDENGKEHGRVKFYYANGQLEWTYLAKNGIPTDTAFRYFNNGDLKEIVVYGDEGRVKSSTQLDAVHPETILKIKKEEEAPLPDLSKLPGYIDKNNLPTGYHKIYNEDGEIWMEGIFQEGILLDGKVYNYDSEGILLKIRIFKSGTYQFDR